MLVGLQSVIYTANILTKKTGKPREGLNNLTLRTEPDSTPPLLPYIPSKLLMLTLLGGHLGVPPPRHQHLGHPAGPGGDRCGGDHQRNNILGHIKLQFTNHSNDKLIPKKFFREFVSRLHSQYPPAPPLYLNIVSLHSDLV